MHRIVRTIINRRNLFFWLLTIATILITTQVSAANLLTVSSKNPRYFADSRGKAVYLTGSHTWDNFQDIGSDLSSPFDYPAYLDFLRDHNHNFFRLWTWEHSAWAPWTSDKLLFHPSPYVRSGPGLALDGRPRFDLEKFNDEYFDRLRERVKQANAREVYVSVMLFNGFSVECKEEQTDRFTMLKRKVVKWLKQSTYCGAKGNPWNGHPFNRHNNINGVDGDADRDGEGKEVHTLRDPRITRLQESYVTRVIDALSEFPNVLWEISNESHIGSTEWQYHMIDFIRRYEKKKKFTHPVIMTVQWPHGDNNVLWNSKADAVSPNPDGGFKDAPPVADGRKVIITDTDHLWGIGGDYAWVWKSFLRGLNPILMDPYRTDILKYDRAKPDWELIRRNMGYTRGFANEINLNSMLPRPDLASSGYCLAAQGKEYLVYAPRQDKITVDLGSSSGDYVVEWFDPLTGKSTRGGMVKGGAIHSFTPPFQGDAVLFLRRSHNH